MDGGPGAMIVRVFTKTFLRSSSSVTASNRIRSSDQVTSSRRNRTKVARSGVGSSAKTAERAEARPIIQRPGQLHVRKIARRSALDRARGGPACSSFAEL